MGFSPESSSPDVQRAIRKYNLTQASTMLDVQMGYRPNQTTTDFGRSNAKNQKGPTITSRLSIDAEEENQPCLTEATPMNKDLEDKNGAHQFINRFKKRQNNEPKFIQKLKSARVYTQGAAAATSL